MGFWGWTKQLSSVRPKSGSKSLSIPNSHTHHVQLLFVRPDKCLVAKPPHRKKTNPYARETRCWRKLGRRFCGKGCLPPSWCGLCNISSILASMWFYPAWGSFEAVLWQFVNKISTSCYWGRNCIHVQPDCCIWSRPLWKVVVARTWGLMRESICGRFLRITKPLWTNFYTLRILYWKTMIINRAQHW